MRRFSSIGSLLLRLYGPACNDCSKPWCNMFPVYPCLASLCKGRRGKGPKLQSAFGNTQEGPDRLRSAPITDPLSRGFGIPNQSPDPLVQRAGRDRPFPISAGSPWEVSGKVLLCFFTRVQRLGLASLQLMLYVVWSVKLSQTFD